MVKVEDETGGIACVIRVRGLMHSRRINKNALKYNVCCDILPLFVYPIFKGSLFSQAWGMSFAEQG